MRRRGNCLVELAVLLLLCAALYLPGLAALPPVDRDEALYAQAARQMVDSGDLLVPRVGDEVRLIKPVGIYWLQAAALHFSPGMAAQRLPSVLGAIVAVLATWQVGRRWFAAPAALLGAALLAASALTVIEAHLATTDAVLLACIVTAQACLAALFTAVRRGRRGSHLAATGFWLAQGLGMLIKGPVAPLVSSLTVAALCLSGSSSERRAGRKLIAALRPWWGPALALACLAPWLLALAATAGWQRLFEAMASDIVPKLTGAHESHGGLPGLYLLLAPVSFWPGSLLMLFGLMHGWRRRHRPAERFLLAWLLPTWLLFECLPTKLPHYVLPCFPALALLAGRAAFCPAARLSPPPRHASVRAALCGWGLIPVALGAAITVAAWHLGGAPVVRVGAILALAIGSATAVLCVQRAWRVELARAAVLGIAGAVLFYGIVLQTVLPGLDDLWLSRRVAAAVNATDGLRPVLAVGYTEASLNLLITRPLRAADADRAVAALNGADAPLVLVSDRQLVAFLAAARTVARDLRTEATVEGLDYTHGRWTVVRLFTVRRAAQVEGPAPTTDGDDW